MPDPPSSRSSVTWRARGSAASGKVPGAPQFMPSPIRPDRATRRIPGAPSSAVRPRCRHRLLDVGAPPRSHPHPRARRQPIGRARPHIYSTNGPAKRCGRLRTSGTILKPRDHHRLPLESPRRLMQLHRAAEFLRLPMGIPVADHSPGPEGSRKRRAITTPTFPREIADASKSRPNAACQGLPQSHKANGGQRTARAYLIGPPPWCGHMYIRDSPRDLGQNPLRQSGNQHSRYNHEHWPDQSNRTQIMEARSNSAERLT